VLDQPTIDHAKPLTLLTGATGYVGGRLLTALEQSGHHLRCMVRRPEFLNTRVGQSTEVVAGDVLDRDTLSAAMHGVQMAYYLVHSMGSTGAFDEEDRRGQAILRRRRKRPVSDASSISEVWGIMAAGSPLICKAARRWGRFYAAAACRPSNVVPPSSSVRGACPLR
jgi:NAD(P)H-binding